MGIPKFFRWISERYPLCSDLITENRVPDFDCLYLDMNGVIHQCSHSSDEKLITSRDESEIFLAIFAYVQALFDKIRPSKLLFLAVDGVAPRAKMNQQRSRRFRTAAEKAEAEAKEVKKESSVSAKVLNDPLKNGNNINNNNNNNVTKYFDTNCITPGTEFMERLSTHLLYFIAKRIDEDPTWRGVKIVFSGPEVPGEGEHKVMEWIRWERSNPDHQPNLRHCLYGLDADLIMLGLLSHEPHFALLREEVTFGRSKNNSGASSSLKNANQVRFHLMHLGLMRDYMQNEFGGTLADSLPFVYDFERILDDFVLLSLFVGNDFLPHLPHLHINENALGLLFDAYKISLPQLDGYLNDCGKIDLKRCAKVLKNVVETEKKVFESECADELMSLSNSKSNPNSNKNNNTSSSNLPPITPKQRAIFNEFVSQFLRKENVTCWEFEAELIANHPEDRVFVAGLAKDFMLILEFTEEHSFIIRKCFEDEEEEWIDPNTKNDKWKFTLDTSKIISNYEKRPIISELELEPSELAEAINQHENSLWKTWKAQYYAEKMEIRETKELDALLQKYCEGLEWVMAYYYEGVASWSWFFNYHYAPFLSDIIEFLCSETTENSDLFVGRYEKIKFDLGRPFSPFEQLMGVLPSLSSALVPAPLATLMTSPESPILQFFPTEFQSDLNGKRNSWEAVVKIPFIDEILLVETLKGKYCLLTETELKRNRVGDSYTFEYNKNGPSITWTAPSASFETLEESRVKMVIQEIKKPAREALRKSLTPGTLFGLEGPPSFPSLRTLPHSSVLKHVAIQVFPGQSSKAITLALVFTDEHVRKFIATPAEIFKTESVHFNWPHLQEGQLVAVTDGERIYTRDTISSPQVIDSKLLQNYFGENVQDYNQLLGKIEDLIYRKQGIILQGGTPLLAVLHPFQCLKLDPSGNGAIIKEFDESKIEIVPLQLLIFNLPRVDKRFQGRAAFLTNPVALIAETFEIGDEVIYVGPSGVVTLAAVDGFVQDGRALSIQVKNSNDSSGDIQGIVKSAISRFESNFIDAKEVAKTLAIPTWLLSKLTSTLQILHQSKSVINVGFGIKYEAKSRAVPDLARRISPGRWEYSNKFVDHLREYCSKFGELISLLIKLGPTSDRPSLDTLISEGIINEIKAWLKSHGYPYGSESAQPCDRVQMIDAKGAQEIASVLDSEKLRNVLNFGNDELRLSPVRPEHLLTRNSAHLYCNQQIERGSRFNAGDRVIWCGDGADGIPFGCFGTVLAGFSNSSSIVLWVLMDKNLVGIGSDLDGFLPLTLKHRGILGKTEKLLKIPHKLSSTFTPKKPDLKVNNNILKFNSAISDCKLEKSNNPSVLLKSNKPPVNMEIIENMLQAVTIKKSDNAVKSNLGITKEKEKDQLQSQEPKQFIKIKTAATITTKSLKPLIENQINKFNSNVNSNDDSNVISLQQQQQQQSSSYVTIKKKSVNTIGTAKLSYSTPTKSLNDNDNDNVNKN